MVICLLGQKGEHGAVAQGAGGPAAIVGAQGLAGVLDDGEAVLAGGGQDGIHVGGLAKGMDGEEGLQTMDGGRGTMGGRPLP